MAGGHENGALTTPSPRTCTPVMTPLTESCDPAHTFKKGLGS